MRSAYDGRYVSDFKTTSRVERFACARRSIDGRLFNIFFIRFVLDNTERDSVCFLFPEFFAQMRDYVQVFFNVEDCGIVTTNARFRRVICFLAKGAVQIVSMTIEAKGNGRFNAWFYDFGDDAPYCVARAKSNCYFAFGANSFVFRRLLGRVTNAGTNDFKASAKATRLRAFANRDTDVFTYRLFVRAGRVAGFTTSCACVANECVRVQACVTPWFRRGDLARARSFNVTLSAKERI